MQGEDDSLTLEYMRKPAMVQRVINSQINEIVGGGRREAIPADMQPHDLAGAPYADARARRPRRGGRHAPVRRRWRRTAAARPRPAARAGGGATPGTLPFEIRQRLIELDDLRRRGILSEEEFAAKKSQLLDRI